MLVKLTGFCASKKGQMALRVAGTLMMALTFGVVVHPNDTPIWP
jgi:hypothetical protein